MRRLLSTVMLTVGLTAGLCSSASADTYTNGERAGDAVIHRADGSTETDKRSVADMTDVTVTTGRYRTRVRVGFTDVLPRFRGRFTFRAHFEGDNGIEYWERTHYQRGGVSGTSGGDVSFYDCTFSRQRLSATRDVLVMSILNDCVGNAGAVKVRVASRYAFTPGGRVTDRSATRMLAY